MYSWWPSERTSTCKPQYKYFCILPTSLLVRKNTPKHEAPCCPVQGAVLSCALLDSVCTCDIGSTLLASGKLRNVQDIRRMNKVCGGLYSSFLWVPCLVEHVPDGCTGLVDRGKDQAA